MSRNTTAQFEPEPAQLHPVEQGPSGTGVRGPTDRVGHLLRRAFQAAQENSARGFADLGLTPRQAAAVWQIHIRGSLSQRELGEAIGMDAPNVHGLVIRLMKRGFVSRARDPRDPRRMRLALTEEGKAIAVALPERARASEEATLAALSPKDRAVLVQLLERLLPSPGAPEAAEAKPAARLNRSFT